MKAGKKGIAFGIALSGVSAAVLECVKLALIGLPNVEGVTLFTALFGYCFGIWGVCASVVFVLIEPLIYGFGTWVISYALYWPLVTIVFWVLGKRRIRHRAILTAAAILLTVWFGVLTTLVDLGLFTGRWDDFWRRFSIMYLRGIWFYVVQVACNAVLFPLLFRFLAERFDRLKKRFLE